MCHQEGDVFAISIDNSMHCVHSEVQEFRLAADMGAIEVRAVLHPVYTNATTWDEMQERWRM